VKNVKVEVGKKSQASSMVGMDRDEQKHDDGDDDDEDDELDEREEGEGHAKMVDGIRATCTRL
jgi:hypothetical protein